MEYNFVEIIKQFDKMCQKYGEMHCSPDECPISALIDLWERAHENHWDNHCLNFAKIWPDRFAEEVMKWAANHEEPIYPTIREIINKICLLMGYDSNIELDTFLEKRLTKEVADYFGIEPINKDKLV